MIKTCWSNRTPFETILILILMVAVPFFVTMIILYLSFIGSYPSESCFKMCKMLSFLLEEDYNKPKEWANEKEKKERWVVGPENFTGEGGVFKQNRRRREPSYEILKSILQLTQGEKNKSLSADRNHHDFPVAALLEKIHCDNADEELFKCTIAKLSSNWALTTNNCFKYETDKWNLLSIRSNSYYWSKGGNIKKIQNVFWYKNLVAIRLKSGHPATKVIYITNTSDSVQTFYWVFNLQLPLQKRLKFDQLQITSILPKKTHDVPMFDCNRNLIGFQSYPFTNENLSEYRSWLEKLGAFA